jgi:site-specific recombinase XerD
VVGYSLYLGVDGEGRKQRRFFRRRPDAEKFRAERNQTSLPVGELWERRTEILYNLERLRVVPTSLTDVVTFYLANGVRRETAKLSAVMEKFLSEKQRIGRSRAYDQAMRYDFGRFLEHVGTDRSIGDITRQEITDYVYEKHGHVSPVMKRNLLTNLSVLFNFAVKEDCVDENPVEKIDRPTVPFQKPHVLTPSDFEQLLRRCYVNHWYDRLTVYVLVGFCGIRVEEASRLRWTNIDLQRQIVEVPATVAKKASFRNNRIPPNAMAWLRAVEDKRRTGPIIGANWKNLLRIAVRFCPIDYRQNCIRHSFCSYALAVGWSLADVIAYMGHSGSPAMIFSHYWNVVSAEDGKRWFEIVP